MTGTSFIGGADGSFRGADGVIQGCRWGQMGSFRGHLGVQMLSTMDMICIIDSNPSVTGHMPNLLVKVSQHGQMHPLTIQALLTLGTQLPPQDFDNIV